MFRSSCRSQVASNARLSQFKQGLDSSKAKQKRQDHFISLRKNDRTDLVNSKRIRIVNNDSNDSNHNFFTAPATSTVKLLTSDSKNILNDIKGTYGSLGLPLLNDISGVSTDGASSSKGANGGIDSIGNINGVITIGTNNGIFCVDKNALAKKDFQKKVDDTLDNLKSKLESNDDKVQFETLNCLRQLVSSNYASSVIDELYKRKLIPYVAYFINPQLQHRQYQKDIKVQAIWIIANICHCEMNIVDEVVSCGAVPYLIQYLFSEDEDISEHATWALGNIAAENKYYAEILKYLPIDELVPFFEQFKKEDNRNLFVWFVRNLFSESDEKCLGTVKQRIFPLPIIQKIIFFFVTVLNWVHATKVQAQAQVQTQVQVPAPVSAQHNMSKLEELILHSIVVLEYSSNPIKYSDAEQKNMEDAIYHQILSAPLKFSWFEYCLHQNKIIADNFAKLISHFVSADSTDIVKMVLNLNYLEFMKHALKNCKSYRVKQTLTLGLSNIFVEVPEILNYFLADKELMLILQQMLLNDSSKYSSVNSRHRKILYNIVYSIYNICQSNHIDENMKNEKILYLMNEFNFMEAFCKLIAEDPKDRNIKLYSLIVVGKMFDVYFNVAKSGAGAGCHRQSSTSNASNSDCIWQPASKEFFNNLADHVFDSLRGIEGVVDHWSSDENKKVREQAEELLEKIEQFKDLEKEDESYDNFNASGANDTNSVYNAHANIDSTFDFS